VLNGSDEWHQRQRELAQKISADVQDQGQQQQYQQQQQQGERTTQPSVAAQKPFVVHSRFRPWTFKSAKKK
jgi:hypothetical protein